MLYKIIYNKLYLVIFVLLYILDSVNCINFNSSFTPDHINYLTNETRHLFKHAWSSYITYGFPADEVRPITCEPYGPDFDNVYNIIRNDAMGNVSSTVLDNLDTLIIMEDWDELENMLSYLKNEKDTLFNKDTIVQVFESTIRSLGGLLSTHLLLTDVTNTNIISENYARLKQISDKYDGFLLNMAYDLGLRLLPAFKTSTNIPVPRINLANGVYKVPPNLQKETCLAGATSPVLEFTLLSKLTGDPQFEYFTQLTFWKLWSSKSPLNLLPMTIDPIANQWRDAITGIGASADSFYEYAAKSSILFNDDYMWSVFKTSYRALLTHSAQYGGTSDGPMIFPNIGVNDGVVFSNWLDSLGAFWTGLQVLTGQLSDAIKTHLVYLKIWDYFDSIPERWNYFQPSFPKSKNKYDMISLEWYPLRPEFIESSYYLYRATRDPMYLQIGERVLNLLKTKFKAKCGFSGIQDIRTGELQNRMETFVMSETLKYLYLLFDTKDEIFLHNDLMINKNWVFSTEGHPLWFNNRLDPLNKINLNNDELIRFRRPIFDSLLSIVKSSRSNKQKLIESQDTSFYRNITLPQAHDYDIPGIENFVYINKTDPFKSRFDKCEISPFGDCPKNFMFSAYYTWDQIFYPDYSFRDSLIKPDYLPQTSLDGSYIELTKPFFDKFTMFVPESNKLYLQCPRIATTEQYELYMGDISGVNEIELSKLIYNEYLNSSSQESVLLEDDLWLPELSSLRLKYEKLMPGLIDTRNNLITEEYIQSLRPDDYNAQIGICAKGDKTNTTRDIKVALRLNKVNGVIVKPGSMIWTLPFAPNIPENGEEPLIDIGSDGRVYFQGNVIENLMVWYG